MAEQSSVPQAEGPLGLDLSPVTPAEHLLSAALAPGGELYQPRPEGLFGHLLQTAIEPLQAAPAAAQGTLADRLAGLGNIVIPYVVGGAPRDALSAGVRLSTGDLGGYHGTPHTFAPEPEAPFGSFRDEAIGSGEGAQAYGWGHYIAGNPKVAEGYQKQLGGNVLIDNKPFDFTSTVDPVQHFALSTVADRGDVGTALSDLKNLAGNAEDETERAILNESHDWLSENKNRVGFDLGHLLEVHILPEESQLLDWDKPLSEQSPEVQEALESGAHAGKLLWHIPEETGHEIYRRLSYFLQKTLPPDPAGTPAGWGYIDHGIGDPQAASQALHSAGIPGLRYLDAGSRNISVAPLEGPSGAESWQVFDNSRINRAGEGQLLSSHPTQAEAEAAADKLRTRNYVIFHPSNLRIVARDGTPLTPVDHDPFAEGAP